MFVLWCDFFWKSHLEKCLCFLSDFKMASMVMVWRWWWQYKRLRRVIKSQYEYPAKSHINCTFFHLPYFPIYQPNSSSCHFLFYIFILRRRNERIHGRALVWESEEKNRKSIYPVCTQMPPPPSLESERGNLMDLWLQKIVYRFSVSSPLFFLQDSLLPLWRRNKRRQ